MLIEHHPSHLNYNVVLTFHNSILLRNTWGRKLLINTMLSHIVTVNSFQAVRMLIIEPQGQAPKVLKYFILPFQEENPRVTRVVVNNDKDIPLVTHGANPKGTDSVHME
jgi:hypothetical protein